MHHRRATEASEKDGNAPIVVVGTWACRIWDLAGEAIGDGRGRKSGEYLLPLGCV